ncbi:MAG: hypothetical protein H0X64_16050 [Gemmatimonadaceae bacterium]|nr:hypothetical protein [Gemmatimonadaceae bacterium]
MSRKSRPPAPRPARVEQTELFPEPVRVERLDPRSIAGSGTSATAVFRVTIGHGGEHHRVFQDRYGTYCEVHGRTCPAVAAVQQSPRS